VFPLALSNVENNVVWSGDNRTILYSREGSEDLARPQGAAPFHRQPESKLT
jgi:hypothetical protein